MDFSWSEHQVRLKNEAAEFARRELNDNLIARDLQQDFDRTAWKKCGEFGIQGLPIPECFGGRGADMLTTVSALEGLGHGCKDNGLLFALHAHLWSCAVPLLTFGSDGQKDRYLPKLCNGDFVGGNAMTEPGAGSDAYSLKTTAERRGDIYVLNGSKIFVTNAPVADILIVFATVDSSKKAFGITAFLVEKNAPGLSVSAKTAKMGLRTVLMGSLTLNDCQIPVECRLGKEGAGVSVFTHAMEWERSFILASAIGSMERQLQECVQYAKRRQQFDKPIGKFQLVSTKLVDMKMRVETSRALLYKMAWLKDQRKSALMEASMTKLHISEAWVQNCMDAMQIHGGLGYMTDQEWERNLRDALGSKVYSGTSEIQRTIIAQFMGL